MWFGDLTLRIFNRLGNGPFNNHSTLTSGLVSYWKLDEQSGTRYDSITATGNDLTDNNTVTYVNAGPAGTSAVFTKANSESLSNASFVGTTTFTAAFWLKTAEATDDLDIFGAGTTWPNSVNFHFRTASLGASMIGLVGSGSAFTQTAGNTWSGGVVNDSAWHLYFLTFDTDLKVRVYRDGPVLGSAGASPALSGSAFTTTTSVFLGGGLNGFLSQTAGRAAYWNRVLTANEMTSVYNGGNGKAYVNLTGSELSGLRNYWNLDEASGSRADSHGSNTLTDNNTVTSVLNAVPPPKNVAAQFTATNSESLSHVSNASLSIGDTSHTWAGWFNLATLGTAVLLAKDASGARGYHVWYNGSTNRMTFTQFITGDVQKNAQDASTATSGAFVWHFFVAWYDQPTQTIYLSVNNGTPASIALGGAVKADAGAIFKIGSRGFNDLYWNGLLDEIGLWSRTLTAQERTDLYNSGRGLYYGDTGLDTTTYYLLLESGDNILLEDGVSLLLKN